MGWGGVVGHCWFGGHASFLGFADHSIGMQYVDYTRVKANLMFMSRQLELNVFLCKQDIWMCVSSGLYQQQYWCPFCVALGHSFMLS